MAALAALGDRHALHLVVEVYVLVGLDVVVAEVVVVVASHKIRDTLSSEPSRYARPDRRG